MLDFTELREARQEKGGTANEEEVLAHAWNHVVNHGLVQHTGGDENVHNSNAGALGSLLDQARNDPSHALHYRNTQPHMYRGGQVGDQDSYYNELENALHTIHGMAHNGNDIIRDSIGNRHMARVMGADRGDVSPTWSRYGADGAATRTSKSDIAIEDPAHPGEGTGINISLKKPGGSQLASAQANENLALHHHAADQMLNSPEFDHLSGVEKDKIHDEIMSHASNIAQIQQKMKGQSAEAQTALVNQGNQQIKAIHQKYPTLNYHLRKEAATGIGKFGVNSGHAAHFFVTTATPKTPAKVYHYEDPGMEKNVYQGPLPRLSIGAIPRINSKGKPATPREGRLRMDQR